MDLELSSFRMAAAKWFGFRKECRFPDDQAEVLARREGRRVIGEPVDEWPPAFLRCLGAWREEIERPRQA